MTGARNLREQHAAEKQRLTDARDEAAQRLSAHEEATRRSAKQLADCEAALVEIATAKALGQAASRARPAADLLEELRADAAVAEPVRIQLAAAVERRTAALKAAEERHKAEVGEYLRETALAGALSDLDAAFDAVREAAVKAMAAHELAYGPFNDRPASMAGDVHGPASEMLAVFRGIDWPAFPYNVRPSWLPPITGPFYPGGLPGVAERRAELLAEVKA